MLSSKSRTLICPFSRNTGQCLHEQVQRIKEPSKVWESRQCLRQQQVKKLYQAFIPRTARQCLRQQQIQEFRQASIPQNTRQCLRQQQIQEFHQVSTPRASFQCLRQQRLNLFRKYPVLMPIRQMQYQAPTRTRWQRIVKETKKLYRENPFAMTFWTVSMPFVIFMAFYAYYFYKNYIIGHFSAFPEPVAVELRRALYFTNQRLDPKRALKHYQRALDIAINEEKLNPFSDQVMGIEIYVAQLYEKARHFHKAIQTIEALRNRNLGYLKAVGLHEEYYKFRNIVLKRTIRISQKLAELYDNEFVMEREKAEEMLTWAIENTLKEQQRREKDGVKEGEGEWFPREEMGAAMERLGYKWEEKDLHNLAAPLFLQAYMLCPPNSCHSAVLMNNLSISLAQQLPPSTPGHPPTSRETLISHAQQWALKAVASATKISGPERTEECDQACAVATHNLGEFAEMTDDLALAREKYEEARGMAKKMKFKEGVKNAERGLKRVRAKEREFGKEKGKIKGDKGEEDEDGQDDAAIRREFERVRDRDSVTVNLDRKWW